MSQGFLRQYGGEIATLTLEHLWLTGGAMLLATAIAVPAGIWLTRAPRWANPVITVANILQTIPSLAMFGFLLPLPWLGDRAARIAILALTAYALLPILRNTYAGIRGIDPAVIEVAQALGLTDRQRLIKVELPLAASFILAGLRTATVTCVGIATIAAAGRRGWLGRVDLSRRGVGRQPAGLGGRGAGSAVGTRCRWRAGVSGAVGAGSRQVKALAQVPIVTVALMFLAALTSCSPPRPDHPVIGAKNFTEQVVLGELLAQES